MLTNGNTRKHTPKKAIAKKTLLWIGAVFFIIVSIIAFYLYNNFNQLLSDALIKNFNSTVISDVYELKFEKLGVDFVQGNIEVYNVELKPREKPLYNYPYINSSLDLTTKSILLKNVEIFDFLKTNILQLETIEITEPDIQIKLSGKKNIFFPFMDTTSVTGPAEQTQKKFLQGFMLKEFKLVDASFHSVNLMRQREFIVQRLNFSVNDLRIDEQINKILLYNKHVNLSIGNITGHLQKDAIGEISLNDYKIALDSLNIQDTPDTTIFHFADFSTGLKTLDMQTADSLFHLTMQSFNLSYKDKSITLHDIAFKPNISEAAMQKKFKYQVTQFAGSVGKMQIIGLNFDSLLYSTKIFIDELILDKVSVSIFKDQTRPVDKERFPGYPGQQIKGIPIPLQLKQLKAANVNLVNRERKPDGGYGKVNVNHLTIEAKNITNLPLHEMLTVKADAFIENKAHAYLALAFNYNKPQFSINGTVKKCNLTDLNKFLQSYIPAKIERGMIDEISFSGNVYRTSSTGNMKFLYHDLKIDLSLPETARWVNATLAFAGNTVLASANPASAKLPPRVVQFNAQRDMHKGFINIIIKSVLNGFKETIMMSKENKKTYRKAKKEFKKKNRKD